MAVGTGASLISLFGGAGATATVGEAGLLGEAAITTGTAVAGAAASRAMMPKVPGMPPSPFTPQAQVDQDTQNAEDAAKRRQAGAQGIDSTVGAGQSGMLNPSTIQSKTLLGQ